MGYRDCALDHSPGQELETSSVVTYPLVSGLRRTRATRPLPRETETRPVDAAISWANRNRVNIEITELRPWSDPVHSRNNAHTSREGR